MKHFTMKRDEFDVLCSKSKKSGDLLFGKIDKEIRKHGIEPDDGVGIQFAGNIVTIWELRPCEIQAPCTTAKSAKKPTTTTGDASVGTGPGVNRR